MQVMLGKVGFTSSVNLCKHKKEKMMFKKILYDNNADLYNVYLNYQPI